MKLLSMSIRNFKGIKAFSLETNGCNAFVFGDNATGKTTLFDAFSWLMFDKDSQNKKDFSAKPLTLDGKEIHNIETEVSGAFEINGATVELKKIWKEKYTKKRGSAESDFTGHTTDYYIDGVPKPKKEFDTYIAGIANEGVFKLLTNPSYFNEQLKWDERRKILLSICGDISDADVIASDKELTQLQAVLGKRSIDDHRKVLAAKRREINDELQRIPVRIDEVKRSMPDVTGEDRNAVEAELADKRRKQATLLDEISQIKNGAAVSEQQTELRKAEGRILEIKNIYREGTLKAVFEKKELLNKLKSDQQQAVFSNKNIAGQMESVDADKSNHDARRIELRKEWFSVNEKVPEPSVETLCPTCGQLLPAEKIESAKQKAEQDFNLKKSNRLESIETEGKKITDKIAVLNIKINGMKETITANEAHISDYNKQIAALEKEIGEMEASTSKLEENTDYIAATREKVLIEQKIQELGRNVDQAIAEKQEELNTLNAEIAVSESRLGKLDQASKASDRVDELTKQQQGLASEYDRIEQVIYLMEQFIRAKVSMLEERINQRFQLATFKLFDQQINGGLTECCETLYNGVPYSSGLNNAARINVGLDIINTLSEHYMFEAPIFVDNAEAVTQLIDTSAQTICLVVSANDKALRVENQTELKEVV